MGALLNLTVSAIYQCSTPYEILTELITPATKYLKVVIPRLDRGIQAGTGCRIKSGMTELACLTTGLIILTVS